MLDVDETKYVQHAHSREGRSIKGISRGQDVSRATVWKIVRTGATSFSYKRRTVSPPKIGPLQSELDGILAENAFRLKRERLTRMQVFEDLRARG